ncbi:protein of unknown function [Azospirillum lipoferum 4B]|uniref:Uncharacterized protein n=1 Tax=Azospirillum lipoferum (strain 4B) TaxID=862719 RepID=G7Z8P3_AZOL4|nr:protein of unknown function [Azospirillum lipoferum 4B]
MGTTDILCVHHATAAAVDPSGGPAAWTYGRKGGANPKD